MTYSDTMKIAVAGDVGKGGLANSKAVAYLNEATVELVPGRFVAISEKGIKEISANTDVLAGVVLRNNVYGVRPKGEIVDVMAIGVADSVFVEIADSQQIVRGDAVNVVASGAEAGRITKETESSIKTAFTVIKVAGNLAEITRL